MFDSQTLTRPLADVRVRDCMHHGVLTCGPDDSLQRVAGIMADYRVHAVVITSGNGARPIGIVSDLDIVTAAATASEGTARQLSATESLTVRAEEPLQAAAQLMNEHGVSHLVVVDGAEGYPLGVLSSLDVASVYAQS